ncbi:MAG: metallophosphoesterase [Alphaproteobacteria bacterium]|nr:metallophosphoesterase [Alphaproteobacteria bacterium]MBF0249872.1 metallophosphoesterase [Alphaproteobacteria bacterium]
MLIAQISDTHILPPDPENPKTLARIQALETFVAHINGLDEKPDCVIHSGDVAHGGTPELYAIVRGILSKLSVPVYFAVGNRDHRKTMVEGLGGLGEASLAGEFVVYAVNDYPVRLVSMDTQHRERNVGTTCSVRLAALEALLNENTEKPTALFMHHPPFEVTNCPDPFQFDDKVLSDAFLDVVASHKHVVHLFCGHMHRRFSVDLGTCVATVTPPLSPDNRFGEFPEDLRGHPLYSLHRWIPESRRFETDLRPAKLG